MSGIPFHTTRMGRTLIEKDIPLLVEYMRQIAHELKQLNANLRAKEEGDAKGKD